MKTLNFIFALLFTTSGFAQYNYKITVLDSFTCTQINQQGAIGLRCVNYQNEIHLAYFYQDQSGTKRLLYGTRGETGLTTETIDILPEETLWGSPVATIQFDASGQVNIYAAYLRQFSGPNQRSVYWYRKEENIWTRTKVADTGYWPLVAADPDGTDGLDFVFWSPSGPLNTGQITYAYYNGINWLFENVSTNDNYYRTSPGIARYQGNIYIAYGEGRCPDTLITKVMKKENNVWTTDYDEIHLNPFTCADISNSYFAHFGISTNSLSLLTSLHMENGVPNFHIKKGSVWEKQGPVEYNGNLTTRWWAAPGLLVDKNGTTYWIHQEAGSYNLSFITKNLEGGRLFLPLNNANLQDFVLKDETIYIYYFEGNSGWPYNTPVMLKEMKIETGEIIGTKDIHRYAVGHVLNQNSPNPFNDLTRIEFEINESENVQLVVFDQLGSTVEILVDGWLSSGRHAKMFLPQNLTGGIYYYVLTTGKTNSVRKMIYLP